MKADSSDRRLGAVVRGWTPPPWPAAAMLQGQYVRLEPLSPDQHARALYDAYKGHEALWDYMAYGPFAGFDSYRDWMEQAVAGADTVFFAVRKLETDQVGGVASYLRIKPAAGVIEVGHINYAPILQQTRAATEAMALMMGWAFDAGYRRYEWKCDALNIASRRAAQRLGFSYEGVFRQAMVVKGRNRDTAWFAVIDCDWPILRTAFRQWLEPSNFDDKGHQIIALRDLTAPARVSSDPLI
ncbi:GNAT family N-acetyltransferase [Pontibaca salina]|uniref:GNAT family N-acetyltransferase n=1 Tax=Pontibaca salina TaxID=2795731 RepID=A0A934HRD9_9RHOB|nr:GNAT family protein [Pontibaca salina]MBI6629270.1 GNAT family N-acetyltransferase [Pontibaca salina]